MSYFKYIIEITIDNELSQRYSFSRYLKHNLNITNLNFKLKMAHSLHQQNIQKLEIEMFKIHHGFPQVSFLDLFHNYNENIFYNLRSQPDTIRVLIYSYCGFINFTVN